MSDVMEIMAPDLSLLIDVAKANLKYLMTVFNVVGYGAKGDGVTDDTVAIQATINASNAAGGGIVFLPPGTYVSTGIALNTGVYLVGAGRAVTIIKMKNGTNHDFISCASVNISNFGISDLTIDGNNTNNTSGAGVVITGIDCSIINVEIKNFFAYGIYGVSGQRLTIDRCYVHNNKNVGILIGVAGNTFTDIDITNCNVMLNYSHGILLGNGSTTNVTRVTVGSNNTSFNGADALGMGGGGIWVFSGASNIAITENIVYGNNGDNIGISGGIYVSVTGNQSSNAAGVTNDQVNSGIAVSAGSVNITINGNECFNNYAAGIILRGTSQNVTVTSNACWNNSQYVNAGQGYPAGSFHGIQISTISPDVDSANFIVITGNRCFDDQTTKTQGYGIAIDANADWIICRNNVVNSNLTGNLLNNASGAKNVFIEGNTGYNPVGGVTAPTLVNGAGIKNSFAFPVRIFLTGGTVTGVFIGATLLTGVTGGLIILQPNESIQVNYTGSPSWTWVGM